MFHKSISSALALAVSITLLLSGCGTGSTAANSKNASASSSARSKLQVSVSFDAMKELVQAVGKEKVDVATIIPDGTEPHDFEPKAKDLVALHTANVFVYNGFGMEKWASKAIESADNPNLLVVQASQGAKPISIADSSKEDSYDPHLWLSLKGAELEAQNIKEALIKAMPAEKAYFEKNTAAFVKQLHSLYEKYAPIFQAAKKKDLITGHAAFAYLCRDFGLTQKSVEDVFADGEPSSRQLAELIQYCKQQQVKTIFSEEMVSPQISNKLAKEVGATVETIDTMENSKDHLTYVERMERNLKKISQLS